ncbi:phosphoglycerate mutase [Bacillus sp. FJAT-27225]|uniref:histidine phosphatase family protein n=1 Tax=Bacillus sp. FJAT-27225 TaxID=1743144 RepID=UPI00080C2331|nr:histidine phosphatase family protein [Bacillus sp. FJAT-27225]OCA83071.1 phosphoglycerate mutase [Bacillus sp. FJAT-27225]
MKKVYMIRHCQADGQEPDAALTVLGKVQAESLADLLSSKQITYIVSSTYERAISTIQPFAKKTGLPIHTDARLAERVLTSTPTRDWLSMLEQSFANPDLEFEGGESSKKAMKRGLAALNDVLAHSEGNAAVVTHGNLLALILGYYDKHFGFEQWRSLSNPDVFELNLNEDNVQIKRMYG